ncbi:hypothetical protein [Pedobacter sp. Hv1]|uniref:hypothetical protein n=1 Tax=Pedobacter sp. Hv1 TaxID=1740090 RepID=UPI0006D890E5|nr:hypothetical protein [Pedobacter sp. Hv1]KQC02095.1 hypothetical protein AQF98_00540 [Pedobacter sp. Hv1]
MKKFKYNGSGQLAFTHQGFDFVIHESGPHDLPNENELVISLVKQGLLTEVPADKKKVLTTNNLR